jgi:hypothetical protein
MTSTQYKKSTQKCTFLHWQWLQQKLNRLPESCYYLYPNQCLKKEKARWRNTCNFKANFE